MTNVNRIAIEKGEGKNLLKSTSMDLVSFIPVRTIWNYTKNPPKGGMCKLNAVMFKRADRRDLLR